MKILACEVFRDESTIIYNVLEMKILRYNLPQGWKFYDMNCHEDKFPAILKCPRCKVPYGVGSTKDDKLFQFKYPFPNFTLSLNVQ